MLQHLDHHHHHCHHFNRCYCGYCYDCGRYVGAWGRSPYQPYVNPYPWTNPYTYPTRPIWIQGQSDSGDNTGGKYYSYGGDPIGNPPPKDLKNNTCSHSH